MRIVRLTAENLKRLVAVQVEPDPAGNLVIVSGRNGAGKSSLLDAIYLALAGAAASKETPQPIRRGEDRAAVTLDLGDLRVTRTWKGERSELRVENRDGARYASPQTMLDHLVGRLSFDPLEFAQQPAKAQRATLLNLIDLPFDLDDLDEERAEAFADRTDISRVVRRLEAVLTQHPEPQPDTPDAEVPTADLVRELQVMHGQTRDNDRLREHARNAAARVDNARRRVEQLRRDLAQWEEILTREETERDRLTGEEANITDPDIDGLQTRIEQAETVNRAVRAGQARRDTEAELQAAREAQETHTRRIREIDERKTRALAEARMPVDGLGIDEHGVTYRSVPFGQCSSAEQLRISMAIAIRANPRLRVILIRDGSLLDVDNMRLIEEMAAEGDYQAWIERVSDDGRVGVVIEDGMLAQPAAARPA